MVIGEGVRIRSHMKLLDATPKDNGEMLLKIGHQLEADSVDEPVMYAEYLTYWFPKKT